MLPDATRKPRESFIDEISRDEDSCHPTKATKPVLNQPNMISETFIFLIATFLYPSSGTGMETDPTDLTLQVQLGEALLRWYPGLHIPKTN